MPDATVAACPDVGYARADLTTFCRLDELGLRATGQRVEPRWALLACEVLEPDQWCRRCGREGRVRDTVVRTLAHEPLGSATHHAEDPGPSLPVHRLSTCVRQDITAAAAPRSKLSRRALTWALEGLVVAHLTVARLAEGLDVAWHTVNDVVLTEGRRVLIDDPGRFDQVSTIGVDEHVWRQTRRGDKFGTVIINLTPIRAGTGPARLLDMVEGRSKKALKTWLQQRPKASREGVEVVAMDGFTGFNTAAAEEIPAATAVMDPFHVVRLAGDALDRCRRRVQQLLHGHRGQAGAPLYVSRRTLHTGVDLLNEKQQARRETLFAEDAHAAVEVTWAVYQQMIGAYRHPNRRTGRRDLAEVIESLAAGVPTVLSEMATLGRTLNKRAVDVLAYFDHPAPATARPKPSTAGSSTYAAPRSGSAT